MHQAIGALVGRLFYGGRLRHADAVAETRGDRGAGALPRQPLVVVDTAARTAAQRAAKGASRTIPASAELTAGLAAEAARRRRRLDRRDHATPRRRATSAAASPPAGSRASSSAARSTASRGARATS